MLLGFHFAIRISEIGRLRGSDIWFETVEGTACLTIVIRSSKTDRHQHGVKRTLMETGCDICPVLNAAQWLGRKGWRPHSGSNLFSDRIGKKIGETLKWIARNNHLDEEDFSTHSLRAGCATALYSAGDDHADIQRWGRWRPSIYMRYIWHENLRPQHLSLSLVKPTLLMDHLRAQPVADNRAQFANQIEFRHGAKITSHHDSDSSPRSHSEPLIRYEDFYDKKTICSSMANEGK